MANQLGYARRIAPETWTLIEQHCAALVGLGDGARQEAEQRLLEAAWFAPSASGQLDAVTKAWAALEAVAR